MKLPPGYVPGVGVTKATAYGGFGEKLLKQYGWKDGEGLGAEGGGIKTALKVLKKDDNIGVNSLPVRLIPCTVAGTASIPMVDHARQSQCSHNCKTISRIQER